MFSDATGLRVVEPQGMFRSEHYPWMLCSIDRLVTTPEGVARGPLEIKVRSNAAAYIWGAEVPDDVLYQLLHYMAALDHAEGWVAVLLGNMEFRWYKVERADYAAKIAHLLAVESEFWHCVETRTPPEKAWPREWKASTRELAPVDNERRVKLDHLRTDVETYLDLADNVRYAQAAMGPIEARIRGELGDAGKGTIDGKIYVNCPTRTVRALDEAALAALDPDVVASLWTIQTERHFSVRRPRASKAEETE
jgi:predicted phage-related endonuclease